MTHIVVDPMTRIEGHLRIEAEVNEAGELTSAFSSGTMVRGLEIILRGRDPREAWAFAQRICGVCTLVHGIASVRAVEHALDYPIPENANLIRNLMVAAQHVHDHVMHFYHLHALDWVDVVSALSADPTETSTLARTLSAYARNSPAYFAAAQTRVKGLVDSGQLGLFAHGYWGHPAYKLPPEVNLLALAHYLDALAWQRDVARLHAIFGGKNPHPNFLVGGMPSPFSGAGAQGAATTFNVVTLQQARELITRMRDFVDQVYLPDTLAIAGYYRDWFERGEGVGNFMTFGEFPENDISDPSSFFIPAGVVFNRDLSKVTPVDLNDPTQIQEFVTHSWYRYEGGKEAGLHPYVGETELAYTGPQPPYDRLDNADGYSYLKSPRFRGQVVEVGPLARIALLLAHDHAPTKALVNDTLRTLNLPLQALYSTMGRTAARALEAKLFVDKMPEWLNRLSKNLSAGKLDVHNPEKWEPSRWPRQARGVGFMEAPRGALAHWVVIEDGRIANYQAVVPSTWNAGPRDANGKPGPYEAALMDRHRVERPAEPLEIQRTVHSFDPCIACAVHVLDSQGEEVVRVRVR